MLEMPHTQHELSNLIAGATPEQFARLRDASADAPGDPVMEAFEKHPELFIDFDAVDLQALERSTMMLVFAIGRASGYLTGSIEDLPSLSKDEEERASASMRELTIAVQPSGELGSAMRVIGAVSARIFVDREPLPEHRAILEAAFGN